MKFAYIDESGSREKDSDVFVMAGILVDAYKLRACTAEFDKSLSELKRLHPSNPDDFKTSSFMKGEGGWRRVSPEQRNKFIFYIINLIAGYGRVYALALSFKKFDQTKILFSDLPNNQDKYWVASSLYISSLIQKKAQKITGNKGLTALIFDDNKQDMPKLSNGLYECDDWYSDIYALPPKVKSKKRWVVKQEKRFDQIINTAFAIKSEHSSLVQVADIISYIYRRNLELFSKEEKYGGEKQLYNEWTSKLDKKREKLGRVPPGSKTVEFYKGISHSKWEI